MANSVTAGQATQLGSPRLKRIGQSDRIQRSASGAGGASSAMDVANQGFSGGGSAVPYRSEMEASFGGVDFSDVRSHTGSAASQANQSLSANAYAAGNQVAFKSANPSKSLVAHELTHVLQQSGGVNRSVQKSGDQTIDTSGEHEAEAVESAVSAGRPAASALTGAARTGGLARKVARDGTGTPSSGALGPRSTSSAPAGGGFGFGISGDAFQAAGTYEIWTRSYSWPVVAVPGLNIMINPSVTAQVQGSLAASGDHAIQAGVQGSVGLGASLGVANGVEAYLTVGPSLNLRATLLREGGVTSFRVGGEIGVSGKIGVKIGGGVIDLSLDLFNVGLLRLDATWSRGAAGWAWDSARSGFGPGQDMVGIWNTIRTMIAGVRAAYDAGVRAARAAGRAVADGARAVSRGVSAAADWVMSW